MGKEKEAQAREELNGLYVGMTRAKEVLCISSSMLQRTSSAQTTWWGLIRSHLTPAPWDEVQDDSDAKKEGENKGQTLDKETSSSASLTTLPALQRASRELIQKGTGTPQKHQAATTLSNQALTGTLIHRVLERRIQVRGVAADAHSPSSLEELVQDVARSMRGDSLGAYIDTAAIVAVIQAIEANPQVQPFLHLAPDEWAQNEVTLSHGGRLLRLDRLVKKIDTGVVQWWVIDYKLHPAPDRVSEYVVQLKAYRQAVQSLQPDEQVRAAFINAQGQLLEVPS